MQGQVIFFSMIKKTPYIFNEDYVEESMVDMSKIGLKNVTTKPKCRIEYAKDF